MVNFYQKNVQIGFGSLRTKQKYEVGFGFIRTKKKKKKQRT